MLATIQAWEIAMAMTLCQPHHGIDYLKLYQAHTYVVCQDTYETEVLWDGKQDGKLPKNKQK